VLSWEPDPDSGDDPQAMVLDELPGWLAERGFDAGRRALWGWSMGGYGCLRAAEVAPGWARAVAAFSPAITPGDAVFADVDALADTPVGLWCGAGDGYYDAVLELEQALPAPPAVTSFGPGDHSRFYWNDHTPAAFAFLADQLYSTERGAALDSDGQ